MVQVRRKRHVDASLQVAFVRFVVELLFGAVVVGVVVGGGRFTNPVRFVLVVFKAFLVLLHTASSQPPHLLYISVSFFPAPV